jgi:hypothetical protein
MHWSHKNFCISLYSTMIGGFIDLFLVLLIILSFGYFTPNWDMKYCFYCCNKDMKKIIKEK